MTYSRNYYNSLDGQRDFDVTFPKLDRTHIRVRVNGEIRTDWSWFNDTRIRFDSGLSKDDVVLIERNTSQLQRIVDYVPPSSLNEKDLDDDSLQAFYMAQEALDKANSGVIDDPATGLHTASGKRITNVADPVDDQDAATKKWVMSGMDSQLVQATAQAVIAKEHADRSEAARDIAEASIALSASSASAASSSRAQAEIAAISAGAPIVSSLTDPAPSDGTVELLSTAAGLQAWEVQSGTWTMLGWVGEVLFDNADDLLVSELTGFADGSIIRTRKEGFTYEVMPADALDHQRETAGGVKLNRIIDVGRENALYGVPGPLLNVEAFTTTTRPVGFWGGYLWGVDTSNRLNRSSDFGVTWELVSSAANRSITQIYPTKDGEMLVHNPVGISKSNGWSINPATATWSTVLTRPAGNVADFLKWGVDGDGQKFIATHYSSVRADSRYVWISTDAGSTWSVAWDTAVEFPDHHQNSHIHAACYDPWADRFWFTEGHQEPVGIRYSDDDGATWTRMNNDLGMNPAFTVMKATDFGIVCGTDGPPNGVFLIRRQDDPDQLGVEFMGNWNDLALREGVIGFADHASRDPDTGIVYVGFGSNFSDVPHVIYACGSSGAYPVFQDKTGSRVFSVYAGNGGIVFQRGTANDWMRAETQIFGAPPVIDRGNLGLGQGEFTRPASMRIGLTAVADGFEAIAIGPGARAGSQNALAVGYKAQALADRGIAIGFDAEATSQSVALGSGAKLTGAFATAVGFGAEVTSSGGVALGRTAKAQQGIAIGQSAENMTSNSGSIAIGRNSKSVSYAIAIGESADAAGASGLAIGHAASSTTSNANAIGRSATASGVDALAIGNAATATHTNSIAIGNSASATHGRAVALGHSSETARSDSVMIGNRDLESTRNGGRIILRSPDGTVRSISIDNSGNIVVGTA